MDNDQIMKLFQELADQGKPVRLINTYRGFPVSYDAQVLSVNQGYVAMSVHEYQAVCMSLEGSTHVQCETLPEVFQASAIAVDVLKKQAILTEFLGVGDTVGRRSGVRVHPSEPVDAEIYTEEFRIGGKIADISVSGMGIYTFATYVYSEIELGIGKHVNIDFKLPGMEGVAQLKGEISSVVNRKGTYQQRIGVKVVSDPEYEPTLQAYIIQRQEQIMGELQGIYRSMCLDRERQR